MRKYLLLFIGCLWSVMCWSVPARRDGRKVKQADGTELIVYAHGDEHFSWLTDAQGRWLMQDAAGNYVVMNAGQKAAAERRMRQARYAQQAAQTPSKLNIIPRGLVVLAEFQDLQFSTPKATIDSMLNGENFSREYSYYVSEKVIETIKANGSVRKYFEASSMGKYSPRFDVVGPLRLSRNKKYYGANASSNSRDTHISDFVTEICEMLVAMGIDLTKYDADNNGDIDYVGIIFAGCGEADSGIADDIWPHKYEVTFYKEITSKGKKFRTYNCNPEMSAYTNNYMGIGTFCHEFGHVLGLPDIYSTDGNTVHKTNGEWDIMDYGCYVNEGDTPPAYTGYERFYMGWATPRVLKEPENVTLQPLYDSNEVLMITSTGKSNLKGNDPDPATFYILDNRQQTGFDSHLPGHGMILTKIDYSYGVWFGNSVNKVANNLHIDLIEADGWAAEWDSKSRGWYGKPGDAFPTGAQEYTGIEDYPLTHIKETDGVITFRVKGGVPTADTQVEATKHTTRKTIRNGQLLIEKDGKVMNALGTVVQYTETN